MYAINLNLYSNHNLGHSGQKSTNDIIAELHELPATKVILKIGRENKNERKK